MLLLSYWGPDATWSQRWLRSSRKRYKILFGEGRKAQVAQEGITFLKNMRGILYAITRGREAKGKTPTIYNFVSLEVECHRTKASMFCKNNRGKIAEDLDPGPFKFKPGFIAGSNG